MQALASAMVRLRMGETEGQPVEASVGGASQQSAKAVLPRAVLALVEYCESPVTSLHATACSCLNLMFQVSYARVLLLQCAGAVACTRIAL
jgi:hypothetical protein